MFCPSCGAEADAEGHYCKRCGGLLPGSRNRRFENALLVMPYLSLLCAILAAASFVALLAAFPGDGGGWAVALAGVSCFLIAVYQFFTFAASLQVRKRFVRGRAAAGGARELDEGGGRGALNPADPSMFAGAEGVTERTTELLEAPAMKSKDARDG